MSLESEVKRIADALDTLIGMQSGKVVAPVAETQAPAKKKTAGAPAVEDAAPVQTPGAPAAEATGVSQEVLIASLTQFKKQFGLEKTIAKMVLFGGTPKERPTTASIPKANWNKLYMVIQAEMAK